MSNDISRNFSGDKPSNYLDPDFFSDGDKGLYLYWGLGKEIYGAKLCDDDLSSLETLPKKLLGFNNKNVWERYGAYNQNKETSWTEGTCMYFRKGIYYLLYSSAGTEFPTYAMGVYTSNEPLGLFTMQKHNPLLRGVSGFVKGAGHGCVVDGPNDSIWAFYTSILGGYHKYERRIGMDRVYFNNKKEMCSKGPTSMPQFTPFSNRVSNCGFLPLSPYCETNVSSAKEGRDGIYAVDENTMSWWQPADCDNEPYISINLGDKYRVHSFRIVWREVGLDYNAGKSLFLEFVNFYIFEKFLC